MSLQTLPPELLCQIASYLDSVAFGSLRLVNDAVYYKTFQSFTDRVAAQSWSLYPSSLETLQAAASDERLQSHLKALRLSTNSVIGLHKRVFEEYREILTARGETFTSDTEAAQAIITQFSKPRPEQHCFTRKTQDELSYVRPDGTLIARALDAIPSLRTIELGEWCPRGKVFDIGHGNHAFNDDPLYALSESRRFFQDPPDSERLIAGDPLRDKRCRLSECFQLLLDALSLCDSSTVRLHRLSALEYGFPTGSLLTRRWPARHGKNTPRELRMITVNQLSPLAQGDERYMALQPVLLHLRELRLALRMALMGPEDRNPQASTWLPTFLTLTPRLLSLEIWFECYRSFAELLNTNSPPGEGWRLGGSGALGEDVYKQFWNECHTLFASLCSETRMERLTSLVLGNLKAEPARLLTLLQRHASSLKRLELAFVKLVERDEDTGTDTHSWSVLIADMALALPDLSSIKLQCLYESQIYKQDGAPHDDPPGLRTSCAIMIFADQSSGVPDFSGCEKCVLESRPRDGCMGEVPSCGHASYESDEGRWPAQDMMRACDVREDFSDHYSRIQRSVIEEESRGLV